jgi:pimeloyl-ACP methyl ester carboxylesterase
VTSGTVEVTGGKLYYEVAGSGDPLVLIHGLGLDLRMWDDQFTELAQHRQVIRYDLRGFGKSTLPTAEPYSHADDLKALLTHLNIARADILGLSMGGSVATNFVLTYPEMARSLILVDSAMSGYQWSADWIERWRQLTATAVNEGPKAACRLWLRHPLFTPALEKPEVASRLTQMITDYSGWLWANRDTHRRIHPADSQRLDQIKVPTLIIIGERDLPDFQAIATILEQTIPNVRKVVIPDVGHMSNMEDPAEFNRVVEDFLDGVKKSI